jgi:HAD superfamily hydrolase (TIGR01457 family)
MDPETASTARARDLERLRRVRCFLLDMDGTVYLGDRLLPGAKRFVDGLRARGVGHLFLTNNSSRNGRKYAEKLSRLGLAARPEQVLTSGAATALYLQRERAGARVYVVGTPDLEAEFAERGFVLTDETPDYAVLGFDTTLTYAKLWKLCDLVGAGTTYVATHPDNVCPTETGTMPDIGALIAAVRVSTGRAPDRIIGKPNRLIAEMAAEQAGVALAEMAMVGDRLYTDIALGAAAGIPAVLLLSGETQAGEVAGAAHPPDFVLADIGALADQLAAL